MMDPTIASVFDPQHNSRYLATFHDFFTRQTMTDVCFVCKNGKKVKAHKMVLAAVSNLLKKILLEFSGTMEDIIIHLPDVSASSLKLVLFFLYEGATRLDGQPEYEEFKSVLDLLGIQPDNSNDAPKTGPGASGNMQQSNEPASYANMNHPAMRESTANTQFSGTVPFQSPGAPYDYPAGMQQLTPYMPSTQTQNFPHRIGNLPGTMVETMPSEPVGRLVTDYGIKANPGPSGENQQLNPASYNSFARPSKRKLADQNPVPTKVTNVPVKVENDRSFNTRTRVDVDHDSLQNSTTHEAQPLRQNQNIDTRNTSTPNVNLNGRDKGGRGRSRGGASSGHTWHNVQPISGQGNQEIVPMSDDCVFVDD